MCGCEEQKTWKEWKFLVHFKVFRQWKAQSICWFMGAKLSPQIMWPQKNERITDSSNPRQWAVWGHPFTGSFNTLWQEQRGLSRLLMKNHASSGLKPVNQQCQSPEWREVIQVLQFWEEEELDREVLSTVSVHFSKERSPCIWGHGALKEAVLSGLTTFMIPVWK